LNYVWAPSPRPLNSDVGRLGVAYLHR
jgi:hypothetical protein